MSAPILSRADAALGDAIEAAVRAKHRRRLRRLGWERALDPPDDGPWAAGDPPPRPGCSLEVLVDGAEALPAIADALQGARQFVHLTGWHVAPHFELVRCEPPVVLGALLAELAERIDVRHAYADRFDTDAFLAVVALAACSAAALVALVLFEIGRGLADQAA